MLGRNYNNNNNNNNNNDNKRNYTRDDFFTFFEALDNMQHYKTVLTRNAQIMPVVWLEQFNKSNRITVL
jgi:hypothetical protein